MTFIFFKSLGQLFHRMFLNMDLLDRFLQLGSYKPLQQKYCIDDGVSFSVYHTRRHVISLVCQLKQCPLDFYSIRVPFHLCNQQFIEPSFDTAEISCSSNLSPSGFSIHQLLLPESFIGDHYGGYKYGFFQFIIPSIFTSWYSSVKTLSFSPSPL